MTNKVSIQVPYEINSYVVEFEGSETNIIAFLKNIIVRAEQKSLSDENPEDKWLENFELLIERKRRNGELSILERHDVVDNEYKVTRDKEIYHKDTSSDEWELVF